MVVLFSAESGVVGGKECVGKKEGWFWGVEQVVNLFFSRLYVITLLDSKRLGEEGVESLWSHRQWNSLA